MTKQQLLASDPQVSVWVTANAGTGKTKVLVDRVLRLLLSGVEPSSILCLTFTKAAASEMLIRVKEVLASWSIMPDEELFEILALLLGKEPNHEDISCARNLLGNILDAPVGIRLQTLHSFCQSIIVSFPIEADIAPSTELADDRTLSQFLYQAKLTLFMDAKDSVLDDSMTFFANVGSEQRLSTLLQDIINSKYDILKFRDRVHSIDELKTFIYQKLEVEVGADSVQSKRDFCFESMSRNQNILSVVSALTEGTVKDQERAEFLKSWCESDLDQRIQTLDTYFSLFLRKDGEVKALQSLATKKVQSRFGFVETVLMDEQCYVVNFLHYLKALHTAQATVSLLYIAFKTLDIYEQLKRQSGVLDFDDLVYSVVSLLSVSDDVSWILYKLDNTIDHVLIDEAQDMSHEQWHIVQAITKEFFAGEGSKGEDRTLFVVGDDKQSIYSFQGASPELFRDMHSYFSSLVVNSGKKWRNVELLDSFRSVPAVLKLVDAVFSDADMRKRVSFLNDSFRHVAFRSKDVGRVELWPLLIAEDQGDSSQTGWEVSYGHSNVREGRMDLADKIARTVKEWIADERILPNKGRPVRPGDIMILLRRRSDFMESIVRAFKKADIAVAGVDRLELTGHLMVEDALSLARFLLMPYDDLSLAQVLTSPLVGFSQDQLLAVCSQHEGHGIWSGLYSNKEDPLYKDVVTFLSQLLKEVDFLTPYEIYSSVFDVMSKRTNYSMRFGGEIEDAINEFLSLVLLYESAHVPSLQGFVQWMEEGSNEIKRDMGQLKDEVRVMTVHGSKGLQSPIVFMPDTCQLPAINSSPMVFDKDGSVLCVLSSEYKNEHFNRLNFEIKEGEISESMRLLYVAMTRAEDELYIAGTMPCNSKLSEFSWYKLLEETLSKIGNNHDDVWVYDGEVPFTEDISFQRAESKAKVEEAINLASCFIQPMSEESIDGIQSVTHSVTSDLEVQFDNSEAATTGNIVHYLLQVLPDIDRDNRMSFCHKLYHEMFTNIHKDEYDSLVNHVNSIIDSPDFQFLFGPSTFSEVPLCGVVDGVYYTGRVDRLIVENDRVVIVDFKTSRTAPSAAIEVSSSIVNQMRRYKSIVSVMYPDRPVNCAILWTSNLSYMELFTDDVPTSKDVQLELTL